MSKRKGRTLSNRIKFDHDNRHIYRFCVDLYKVEDSDKQRKTQHIDVMLCLHLSALNTMKQRQQPIMISRVWPGRIKQIIRVGLDVSKIGLIF